MKDCSETKESCESQSDNDYIYTWYPPVNSSQCCGYCNRTERNLSIYYSKLFTLVDIYHFLYLKVIKKTVR